MISTLLVGVGKRNLKEGPKKSVFGLPIYRNFLFCQLPDFRLSPPSVVGFEAQKPFNEFIVTVASVFELSVVFID